MSMSRVRAALHVDDVLIVEAPHYVDNGVRHADVGEELVSQALALAGALHQTRDVHELDDGGGGFLGIIHFAELVQPGVRHGHHAHIGIDGAEGVIGALRAGVGNSVEQGRFPHVGQTHDS